MIVLTTTPDNKEAEILAEKIVAKKLAACVQILPRMTSFYFWKGAIRKESEHLLVIKTLPEKFDALSEFIQANHSYEIPEILGCRVTRASSDYWNWLNDYLETYGETKFDGTAQSLKSKTPEEQAAADEELNRIIADQNFDKQLSYLNNEGRIALGQRWLAFMIANQDQIHFTDEQITEFEKKINDIIETGTAQKKALDAESESQNKMMESVNNFMSAMQPFVEMMEKSAKLAEKPSPKNDDWTN